jgi:hypothetical protein
VQSPTCSCYPGACKVRPAASGIQGACVSFWLASMHRPTPSSALSLRPPSQPISPKHAWFKTPQTAPRHTQPAPSTTTEFAAFCRTTWLCMDCCTAAVLLPAADKLCAALQCGTHRAAPLLLYCCNVTSWRTCVSTRVLCLHTEACLTCKCVRSLAQEGHLGWHQSTAMKWTAAPAHTQYKQPQANHDCPAVFTLPFPYPILPL